MRWVPCPLAPPSLGTCLHVGEEIGQQLTWQLMGFWLIMSCHEYKCQRCLMAHDILIYIDSLAVTNRRVRVKQRFEDRANLKGIIQCEFISIFFLQNCRISKVGFSLFSS